MLLLIFVTFAEGADNSLFPSVTKAMENTIGFDVSDLGGLATVQLIFQAFAGPAWGIIASRGIMTRRTILVIGTFFQGLATAVMWMYIENYPLLLCFRAVNGISLASLRPIANSIVGDRFDDTERGQFFGWIMFALQLGIAITGIYATSTSEWVISGTDDTNDPNYRNNFFGWELAFIVIGGACMALSPLIFIFLKAPPVKVPEDKGQGSGAGQEFGKLLNLIQVPTFAILVLQGCFGLIPWRAFDFRTFFFQTAGLSNGQAATVNACGGFGAAIGSASGGYIGDFLNQRWHLHGRVLAAEIAVYGGIPVAYFTFMLQPSGGIAFVYYLALTIGLGLIATWTPGACNNPVLCALASEDERALVIAWQTSLEGAVGALGPIIFTWLLRTLGYNPECNKNPDLPGCDNVALAGYALFLTSCLPWLFCGGLYSCLHCTYPRDLKRMQDKWAAEASGTTTELTQNQV